MFLSRGNRDLGVAFQTHLRSQAWYIGEAKNSALLSSPNGYLLEPTEWPKGSQASCGVWREASRLLSRPCRRRRPSSRDDGGVSWVFWSLATPSFLLFTSSRNWPVGVLRHPSCCLPSAAHNSYSHHRSPGCLDDLTCLPGPPSPSCNPSTINSLNLWWH